MPIRSNPALQKAETEWNTANQVPSPAPYCGMKRMASSMAPVPSKMSVPMTTVELISMMRATRPPTLMLSAITARSRMLMRRRIRRKKSVAMVMKPRPPIWMSVSITPWPKNVHWVQVSARARPVTQEQLTAVNMAVMKPALSPSLEATGSISSAVPHAITRKNPSAIICTCVSCRIFIVAPL